MKSPRESLWISYSPQIISGVYLVLVGMCIFVFFPWIEGLLTSEGRARFYEIRYVCFLLLSTLLIFGLTRRNLWYFKEYERSLQRNQARVRSIVDTAVDGIVTIDVQGCIETFNPAAETIFGYSSDEVVGKNVSCLMPAPYREEHDSYLSNYLDTGDRKIIGIGREVQGLRKDGSVFPMYLSVGEFEFEGRRRFTGIVHDLTDIKLTEAHLNKLSQAVKQSANMVMITDVQGVIEYVNPRFTEVTGYQPEEVIGRNPRFLKSGATEPEEYKELWDTIQKGEVWSGKFHNRKKGGDLYWERVTISPIQNTQGTITHYLGIKEDITGQVENQRQIEINHRREEIFSNLSRGVVLRENLEEILPERLSEIGRLLDLKGVYLGEVDEGGVAILRGFGWEEGSHTHRRVLEKGVLKWWKLAVSNPEWIETLEENHALLFNRDGELSRIGEGEEAVEGVFPLHVEGRLLGFLRVIGQDRLEWEEEDLMFLQTTSEIIASAFESHRKKLVLQESELKYRRLYNQAPAMYFALDLDGNILEVNDTTLKKLGYRLEEMLDRPVFDFVSSATNRRLTRAHENLYEEDKISGEIQMKTASQDTLEAFFTLVLERNLNQVPTGIKAICIDISETKQLQQQLIHADRLSAVGRLAAGISHEINQPLACISMSAEILLAKLKKAPLEDQVEFFYTELEDIFKQLERVENIIQNIKTFSRDFARHQTKVKSIDLNQVITSTISFIRRQFEKQGIEINTNLASDLPVLYGDDRQLEQVLVNFFINAKDAIEDREQVEEVREEWDKEVTVTTLVVDEGEGVELIFSDTGVGIDFESIDKIYEPFYSTKEVGRGTGLGLSISYGIISEMGGKIECHSEPNEGTEFRVYFPVNQK